MTKQRNMVVCSILVAAAALAHPSARAVFDRPEPLGQHAIYVPPADQPTQAQADVAAVAQDHRENQLLAWAFLAMLIAGGSAWMLVVVIFGQQFQQESDADALRGTSNKCAMPAPKQH